jgi:hypothetical protein
MRLDRHTLTGPTPENTKTSSIVKDLLEKWQSSGGDVYHFARLVNQEENSHDTEVSER